MTEITGSFHVIGLDKNDFNMENDKVQFRLGLYIEKTIMDWLLIDISFDQGKPVAECFDGFSKINSTTTI